MCTHLHNITQTPTNQLNVLLLQLLDNEAKTFQGELILKKIKLPLNAISIC